MFLVSCITPLNVGVSISSDFIAGFCGETLAEHQDTVSLMEAVVFDQAFMVCTLPIRKDSAQLSHVQFAYSLRGKTHASHNYLDDVPEPEKLRRLQEVYLPFMTWNDAFKCQFEFSFRSSQLLGERYRLKMTPSLARICSC